jgi:putative hemolysin
MPVRDDQHPAEPQAPASTIAPAGAEPLSETSAISGPGATRPETGVDVVSGDGQYRVRVARDDAERRAAQRVRYEVFHLELGEGNQAADGLDEDPFDAWCDHLILIDVRADRIVGTYRLQTYERAATGQGLYCGQEFAVEMLPDACLQRSVELGRACVVSDHRQGQALFALWRGIAEYMTLAGKRFLFGCCSLTGVEPEIGRVAEQWLRVQGKAHRDLFVPVRPSHLCPEVEVDEAAVAAFRPPKLFGTYLRYGALNCSPPAIDRAFGTIDFLVLLDIEAIDPRLRRLFFDS